MRLKDTEMAANARRGNGISRGGVRVAIQGERGSNSHMAALAMLPGCDVVPCNVSADVVEAVVNGCAERALLPIENSLHGSVAEHYDLLMQQPVWIERESLMRIRHNLIAAPGVRLDDVRWVMSHPVALSQCRRYLTELTALRGVRAMPYYDTAGSVKHVIAEGLRDTAGVAPELAAEEYGGNVLVEGIEDHEDNYTRFHLLRRVEGEPQTSVPPTMNDGAAHEWGTQEVADKMSLAFAVEHKPGTLVAALQAMAAAGADLTQIESRPVPGKPWEYVFYVDLRFAGEAMADAAVAALRGCCGMVKELGRYKAA
jgi:prephenate dehydratase